MAATVFPAAAPGPGDDRQHPSWCACPTCTADMLASITRPLIQGGVAVDQAQRGRNQRPTNRPRANAGEADARLDARGTGSTSASEAPNRVAAWFGAGDSSPAGFTETRTRRLSRPGSDQPQAPVGGQGVGGEGVAGLGRPATPAPGGAR
ncbi:hypothetical protein [Micromonospora aurantiaca (nom. illeg.)]|uniref:hypothetical protein n=1 Tax=Micromonospora aurantiaca (nom. illeg.) TaxID=47850 RepID=UPI0033FA5C3E